MFLDGGGHQLIGSEKVFFVFLHAVDWFGDAWVVSAWTHYGMILLYCRHVVCLCIGVLVGFFLCCL